MEHLIVMYFTKQFKIIEAINVFLDTFSLLVKKPLQSLLNCLILNYSFYVQSRLNCILYHIISHIILDEICIIPVFSQLCNNGITFVFAKLGNLKNYIMRS